MVSLKKPNLYLVFTITLNWGELKTCSDRFLTTTKNSGDMDFVGVVSSGINLREDPEILYGGFEFF